MFWKESYCPIFYAYHMSNVLTYSMGKFLYLTKCFFILIGMQMAVQLTQI